jgi:hypothetical protein
VFSQPSRKDHPTHSYDAISGYHSIHDTDTSNLSLHFGEIDDLHIGDLASGAFQSTFVPSYTPPLVNDQVGFESSLQGGEGPLSTSNTENLTIDAIPWNFEKTFSGTSCSETRTEGTCYHGAIRRSGGRDSGLTQDSQSYQQHTTNGSTRTSKPELHAKSLDAPKIDPSLQDSPGVCRIQSTTSQQLELLSNENARNRLPPDSIGLENNDQSSTHFCNGFESPQSHSYSNNNNKNLERKTQRPRCHERLSREQHADDIPRMKAALLISSPENALSSLKFAKIFNVMNLTGFETFDEMAIEYYTAPFHESDPVFHAQRRSRCWHLPKFISKLNRSAKTWTAKERRGWSGEIVNTAEALYIQEFQNAGNGSQSSQSYNASESGDDDDDNDSFYADRSFFQTKVWASGIMKLLTDRISVSESVVALNSNLGPLGIG